MLLNAPDLLVSAMAFSPDSQILATGGYRYHGMTVATLQLWNAQTGQRLSLYRQFSEGVGTMVFSPDGRWLAVGVLSADKVGYVRKVLLLNLEAEEIREIPEDFGPMIATLAFSPDSSMLAVSSGYSDITVYNVAANKHQINYKVQGGLGYLLFSADNRLLLSAGDGGEAITPGVLHIWDMTTGQRLVSPQFPEGINVVALSPNGEIVAVTSGIASDRIWLWNLIRRDEPSELRLSVPATDLTFGDDGHLIVTHNDGTVREWKIQNGENTVMLDYSGVEQNDRVAISPNGNLLALADYREREIRLWDSTTRKVIDTFSDDVNVVSYLDFDQDGVELHLGIGNRRYIWNLETGSKEPTASVFTPTQTQNDALTSLVRSFYPGQHTIESVTAVPNSSLVLVDDSVSLTFWDMNTRMPLTSMRFFGYVRGFSADGSVLLTQSHDSYWLWAVTD